MRPHRYLPIRSSIVAVIAIGLLACAGTGGDPRDGNAIESRCDATSLRVAFISEGGPEAMNKVVESARRLTVALGSTEFQRSCRLSQMNRTGGRSIAEVCSHLSCAGEQELRVGIFHDPRMRTVAFEKNGAVFINSAKVRAGSVSNLAHEFAHVLGYSHQSYWGLRKKGSVPYVVGRLAADADR